MRTFVSRFAGAKLLERLPPIQGVSFSTRGFASNSSSKRPDLNILFFCPRNEEHFQKFRTEYPDLIHDINPKSVSVSDIAHNPNNSATAVKSLLGSNVSPSVIIPHLVLIGHTKDEADKKIESFRDSGIESILVIRGNPATVKKDLSYTHHPEGYEDMPHLMKRIKDLAPNMKIIVAGYPEKHPFDVNERKGLDELKKKVDAGADMIVTQHFFNNNHFVEFLDNCQKCGIDLPMIPSIMPIGNPKYLFSFSRAADIAIPAEVSQILFAKGSEVTADSETIENEQVRRKAVDYTAGHIRSLIDLKLPQVDRINTYAANNVPFLREVLDEVGVTKSTTASKEDSGRS